MAMNIALKIGVFVFLAETWIVAAMNVRSSAGSVLSNEFNQDSSDWILFVIQIFIFPQNGEKILDPVSLFPGHPFRTKVNRSYLPSTLRAAAVSPALLQFLLSGITFVPMRQSGSRPIPAGPTAKTLSGSMTPSMISVVNLAQVTFRRNVSDSTPGGESGNGWEPGW